MLAIALCHTWISFLVGMILIGNVLEPSFGLTVLSTNDVWYVCANNAATVSGTVPSYAVQYRTPPTVPGTYCKGYDRRPVWAQRHRQFLA